MKITTIVVILAFFCVGFAGATILPTPVLIALLACGAARARVWGYTEMVSDQLFRFEAQLEAEDLEWQAAIEAAHEREAWEAAIKAAHQREAWEAMGRRIGDLAWKGLQALGRGVVAVVRVAAEKVREVFDVLEGGIEEEIEDADELKALGAHIRAVLDQQEVKTITLFEREMEKKEETAGLPLPEAARTPDQVISCNRGAYNLLLEGMASSESAMF